MAVRFRFSLRALLIVCPIIALGIAAPLANRLLLDQSNASERRVARLLEQAGAKIEWEDVHAVELREGQRNIAKVIVDGTGRDTAFVCEQLVLARQCTSLGAIGIANADVNGEVLSELGQLKRLSRLELQNVSISANLGALSRVPGLQMFACTEMSLTREDVAGIASWPRIQVVRFKECDICRDACDALPFDRLAMLSVGGISENAAERIIGSTTLRAVSIDSSASDREGVAILRAFAEKQDRLVINGLYSKPLADGE